MLDIFERLLFEKFKDMPAWVRVFTYFAFLFLFIYLTLVPRFVNGQLVVKDSASGGILPYRGAEMQMEVDGHDYKFKANERGYWSIPIISKFPSKLELQIYHNDVGQWFPVTFSTKQIWTGDSLQIEIGSKVPYVTIVAASDPQSFRHRMLVAVEETFGVLIPQARAGLILPSSTPAPAAAAVLPSIPAPAATPGAPVTVTPPPTSSAATMASSERRRIQDGVVSAVAKVVGTSPEQVGVTYRLTGDGAPSYVQKIRIVGLLEQQFDLSIPDEHWTSMATVGQLVDYIQKRQILFQTIPEIDRNRKASWPAIQQSVPQERRPIYKPGGER